MSNAYDYETNAALYYERFGRLAPGKSEAPEMRRDSMDDENRAQYDTWMASGIAWRDSLAKIAHLEEQLADTLVLVERKEVEG